MHRLEKNLHFPMLAFQLVDISYQYHSYPSSLILIEFHRPSYNTSTILSDSTLHALFYLVEGNQKETMDIRLVLVCTW